MPSQSVNWFSDHIPLIPASHTPPLKKPPEKYPTYDCMKLWGDIYTQVITHLYRQWVESDQFPRCSQGIFLWGKVVSFFLMGLIFSAAIPCMPLTLRELPLWLNFICFQPFALCFSPRSHCKSGRNWPMVPKSQPETLAVLKIPLPHQLVNHF